MTLAKLPSDGEVARFIATFPREKDEPQQSFLRRLLKEIVLANTQTRVANIMGICPNHVADGLASPRVTLEKMCRLADACGCEVILSVKGHQPGASEG